MIDRAREDHGTFMKIKLALVTFLILAASTALPQINPHVFFGQPMVIAKGALIADSVENLNHAYKLYTDNNPTALAEMVDHGLIWVTPYAVVVVPERLTGLRANVVEVRMPGHPLTVFTSEASLHQDVEGYFRDHPDEAASPPQAPGLSV